MLESFDKTHSDGTKVVVYIDSDDPFLEEYHQILYKKYSYYVDERKNVAQIHNFLVDENKWRCNRCNFHLNEEIYDGH
jgi:hypothetical protein